MGSQLRMRKRTRAQHDDLERSVKEAKMGGFQLPDASILDFEVPDLQKFNLNTLLEDSTILVIGKRREGKTFLVDEILYRHKRHFPCAVVFTRTAFNGHYQKRVPKPYIHNGYKPAVLTRILARQRRVIEAEQIDPRLALIFDDTASEPNLRYDPYGALESVGFEGRHMKLFCVITSQRLKRVVSGFRECADFVFIFWMDNADSWQTAWSEWCADIPKDLFYALFKQYTQGYCCLVINRSTKSKRFEDKYFFYEAEEVPDYVLGSEAYWEMAQMTPFTKKRRRS